MQELSALAIDAKSKIIIDVFHVYGDYSAKDEFAREHIHGLNELFLACHSIGPESKLIESFVAWLKPKKIKAIYANDPDKESSVLNYPVLNFPLPIWVERQHKRYHRTAINLKNMSYPICQSVACPRSAHNSFVCPPKHRNFEKTSAQRKHGYHCSLYDVMELYLAFYES